MTGRVLVLGNAGVDLSIAVPRLPRPGETLVGGPFRRAPGGKGLNQAVMAARAGAHVRFCAQIGRDGDGDFVEAALRREPIAELRLARCDQPTDVSVIAVAEDGENCILSSGASAEALSLPSALLFGIGAEKGDVVLLQGNLGWPVTKSAAQVAAKRGARVIFNAAPLRWPLGDLLADCWGIVANTVEAELITGRSGQEAVEALVRSGPAMVAVTLGAKGCMVNGTWYPPVPAAAVDTTGAGDAFCGTLAACLARGMTVAASIPEAQRAAADTVTRPGAFASLPPAFELRG